MPAVSESAVQGWVDDIRRHARNENNLEIKNQEIVTALFNHTPCYYASNVTEVKAWAVDYLSSNPEIPE